MEAQSTPHLSHEKEKKHTPKYMEPIVFLIILGLLNVLFIQKMGLANMLNTMMNTAYQLLIQTALYIMAIAVIMSAFSALLTEFGVIELINHILSPLMRPLYDLPGAAALGVVTTHTFQIIRQFWLWRMTRGLENFSRNTNFRL